MSEAADPYTQTAYIHRLQFYCPLPGSVTTWVGRYQNRHSPTHTSNVLWVSIIILDFMRCGEDNRDKCADNPAGCHPIRSIDAPTSIIPKFYAGCPSCRNPPNLSWLGTGTKYAGLHTWRLGLRINKAKQFHFCIAKNYRPGTTQVTAEFLSTLLITALLTLLNY